MAIFEISYQITQTNEGWSGQPYKDNNGAWCRYGVNQEFWPDMPGGFYSGAMDDATALAAAEGHYRNVEWKAVHGDDLADQVLTNHLFDMAVNVGVGAATLLLQAILNDQLNLGLAEDGAFGPATLTAITAHPHMEWLYRLGRVGYYTAESLKPQGKGWLGAWLARVKRCG